MASRGDLADRVLRAEGGNPALAPLESVYKPNVVDYEVVGITGTTTYSFQANSTTSVVWAHPVGSEWTERADSARLSIRNDSAATRIIYGVSVRGTPVIRLSGKSGFIHDEYVDYEDIGRNGEQPVEIGNNYITSADLTNRVANWWWRNIRSKKHYYTIKEAGFCSFYEVGEWYTLTVTSTKVWNIEAVNSTVECVDMQSDLRAGEVGETTVTFREVYQNWVYDNSAAIARYYSGLLRNRPKTQFVTVASRDYIGDADYYCDGVDDQIEIQQAIGYISSMGGGMCKLTRGMYIISSTITNVANLTIIGEGDSTNLYNTVATATITISSEVTVIKNMKFTGATSFTGITGIVTGVGKIDVIENTFEDAVKGIYFMNVFDSKILRNRITNDATHAANVYGIMMEQDVSAFREDNVCAGNTIATLKNGNTMYGIYIGGDVLGRMNISDNVITDITSASTSWAYGIYVGPGTADIFHNSIRNVKNTTATALVGGIFISNTSNHSRVLQNAVFNCGNDTDHANTSTCIFHDAGASTQTVANTWQ